MVRSWKRTGGSSGIRIRATEKDNTWVWTMGQQDQNELAGGKRQEGQSTGRSINTRMEWKGKTSSTCLIQRIQQSHKVGLYSYKILLSEHQDQCPVPATLGARHLNWKQNCLHTQVTRYHKIDSRYRKDIVLFVITEYYICINVTVSKN